MHPLLIDEIARQKVDDLRNEAARHRRQDPQEPAPRQRLKAHMRRSAAMWDTMVRGGRALGAALWEFGVDVYNAIKHVDPDAPRAGRS
jgi:hypothetical protein